MRVVGAPDELDGPLTAGARVGTVEARVGGTVVGARAARHRDRGRGGRARRRAWRRCSASRRRSLLIAGLAGLYRVCSCCCAGASSGSGGSGVIITVTLNAAIDKTLSVPNFRLGRRHRTVEQTTMAGGKGVNIARDAQVARPAGDRDRASRAGRPARASSSSSPRSGSSTTSCASARSRGRTPRCSTRRRGEQTEINERGPAVAPRELELFLDKLIYLSRGAEIVVFAGSLPRGVDVDAYATLIRELRKLGVTTIVDTDGEPLRQAVRAEPTIISPNVNEAEELVGHEFNDEEDMLFAIRELGQLGPREAIMTTPDGCFACLQGDGGPGVLPGADRAARAGRHGRLGRRVPRRLRRGALRGPVAGGLPALRRGVRRGLHAAPGGGAHRPPRGRAAGARGARSSASRRPLPA